MRREETSVWTVFRVHRSRWLLAGLLVLVTMLAGTGLLAVSGSFLTAAALAGAAGVAAGFNFFSPAAGIRALTLVRIVSRYGEKLVGHDAVLRIARDLRVWFFRRALPLAPAQLPASRIGQLLARLMSDIGEVDGLAVRALAPLGGLVLSALAGVLAAALLYWPAALVIAATGLAVALLVPWRVARGAAAEEDTRAAQRGQLRTLAFEGLEGAADLRALQAESGWAARIDEQADALQHLDARRRRRLVAGNWLQQMLGAAGLVAMLALVLWAHGRGQLAAAPAAGLVFLTMALLEVWAGAGMAWQALAAGRVAAQRLQAIVTGAETAIDPPGLHQAPAHGELHCAGLGFAWPGGPRLLDGLDLVVAEGERIAIEGDSGCGKSTLSGLLLRLWEPSQGRVEFGGIDLRDLDQGSWHQRVAWLPQNAPVFAASVRDNLLIGDPGADDAALWAVLQQVRLADWARAQGGLERWVGENGASLSAGQARRLALARALLRQAPVLLLDEPTEGLDVDTADALLLDLAHASNGRTVILISHAELPAGVVHRRYRLLDGRLERLD